jgi:dihydroorotate dehydrogenase (fumarate)
MSPPGPARLSLRRIALLHGRLSTSLAATGGVHSGVDAIKLLMAGADVTMVCSALMRHGVRHLKTIEREMEEWIATHDYRSVDQLKGSLSQRHCPDPAAFERAHYIRAVGSFAQRPALDEMQPADGG